MTTAIQAQAPEWNLADGLHKTLREADITAEQMARYMDVSTRTVSRWLNGHNRPSTASLRVWAMLTGVEYEWLAGLSAPSGTRTPNPLIKCIGPTRPIFLRLVKVTDRAVSGVGTAHHGGAVKTLGRAA